MSLGRRINLLVGLSKSLQFSTRRYMSTSVASATVARYPLGKDLSWLPRNPTSEDVNLSADLVKGRPVSLLYRVLTMIELSDVDGAIELARLSVLKDVGRRHDTILICNAVIGAMCQAKRYEDGIALFHYFFNENNIVPNIASFNHVIKAFCELGRVDDALQLYRHAARFGADKETFSVLTQALVDAYGYRQARLFVGLSRSLIITDDWTPMLIEIRGRLDQMDAEDADDYFHKYRLEYDDLVDSAGVFKSIATIFVEYWFKHGNDEKAIECYSSIRTWESLPATTGNSLLRILLAHGKEVESGALFEVKAKDLFHSMLEKHKRFDSETINIMVDYWFEIGEFNKAMETFNESQQGRKRMVGCYSNVIARLCERGMMSEAEGLFEDMCSDKDLSPPPDVSTFRSMVNGYVRAGRVDDAIKTSNKLAILKLRKVSIYED
ncbi:Pentatricopeptide repeat-containing protein [Raphanus sativus]|uniref:Pentatricopeptide repeat-containing protein At3g60960, mitochondrial-like n=1 Tax=Raphanus sativus TaxID=3726 RepID=A0A6J0JNS7_RAPSA|nr:pentatricopeptide repeat-containing protein At3g60960, mitochondrial-like [Raphanus sativus]KAJ4892494.1 Pentatricopeptide repeat-containing protein [Raphanus sativus]